MNFFQTQFIMDAILSPNPQNLHEKKILEDFFNDYPAEKAEQLFWRWLVAGLQNDFDKLTQEDLQEFCEFFERLQQLELQCLQTRKSEGGGG